MIFICPPLLADGDAAMRMFNADGSEGAMCGNGVRCAAEFLYTHGVRRDCIRIDTPTRRAAHAAPRGRRAVAGGDGPLLRRCRGCRGRRRRWAAGRCWMCRSARAGAAGGSTAWPWATRTAYVFTGDAPPAGADAGPVWPGAGAPPGVPRAASTWSSRSRSAPPALAVTVWERGSGATLACGTGACAVAAAAVLTGRCPTRRAHFGADARRHTGGTRPNGMIPRF